MTGTKKKTEKRTKFEIAKNRRSLLVKAVEEETSPNCLLDKSALKRALDHLTQRYDRKSQVKKKEPCRGDYMTESRIDSQVKLKCRQLPNVVDELRKAIMRHDWDETVTLLMILCHPGLKLYSTIIIRTCFILLFHHPKSNLELLQKFVRLTTGYILEEDVNKFIKIMFALRKCPLKPLESGKYIRKTGDYKVTRDPEFDEL